jgi:DNA replication protein DnaC
VADCELWLTLAAAGPKAIAEALSTDDIERLHIPTSLESFVEARIKEGCSIVLTGNAGDGKTHILRRIRSSLEAAGAVVIEDATAEMIGDETKNLLSRWKDARAAGKSFCLAANEYPLYQLRSADERFDQLDEVFRQCKDRLAYGPQSADEQRRADVLVIDLSLRNPLSETFFGRIIDAILQDQAFQHAINTGNFPIAKRNRDALTTERIRQRLGLLVSRLVAMGYRATMRELWILASRIVFGKSASGDYLLEDWYSETLFRNDTRFEVTTIFREVDPARCSHPRWDSRLESRTSHVRTGWVNSPPTIPPQPILKPETFAALKRRFYFEHESGGEAFAMADSDATEFQQLLAGETESNPELVSTMVNAINAAYCPVRFAGREHHLYLWNGHRFHEQPSRSFVASNRIGTDALTLQIPRLPTRLENCFDYQPDHFAITATSLPNSPRLRVDFPLFRTLKRLSRGLPRKLIPERDVHRLDAFLEKLASAAASSERTIWSVHLESLDVIQVMLNEQHSRYEGVRRLA